VSDSLQAEVQHWQARTDDMSALDWLMNLLSLASQGTDIETGAEAFIKSMLTLSEERVHLCRVEKIEL